jgi:hypothetical protein
MADHCPLCERPRLSPSEFCTLHSAAHDNLEDAYAAWSKSYDGNLTREEYFTRLEKLGETGPAAKAVIQHLREKNAGP